MQEISSVSFQGNKKQKEKKNVKGGIGAYCAGSLAATASLPIGMLSIKNLVKPSKELTKDQIEIVNKGAQKALDELAGLSKKGVEIIDFRQTSEFGKLLPEWLVNLLPTTDAVANGKNAAFQITKDKTVAERWKSLGIKNNSIIVNKDKLSLSTFHEIGHAFNYNNSKFWKAMQGMRSPMKHLGSLIMLLPAITKEHKAKEGEELTTKQKFINGLRNASPFIASASFIPMFAEEAKATLRGNKWAKEVFKDTPELAKKVAKTNKWGLISYAVPAIAMGFGTWVVKKIKDNSDAKKEMKVYAHQG